MCLSAIAPEVDVIFTYAFFCPWKLVPCLKLRGLVLCLFMIGSGISFILSGFWCLCHYCWHALHLLCSWEFGSYPAWSSPSGEMHACVCGACLQTFVHCELLSTVLCLQAASAFGCCVWWPGHVALPGPGTGSSLDSFFYQQHFYHIAGAASSGNWLTGKRGHFSQFILSTTRAWAFFFTIRSSLFLNGFASFHSAWFLLLNSEATAQHAPALSWF